MSGRSERRHHVERLRKKRRGYWCWGKDKSDRIMGILINTPTPCSCHACGNPRKYFKEKTYQEKKVEQDYK